MRFSPGLFGSLSRAQKAYTILPSLVLKLQRVEESAVSKPKGLRIEAVLSFHLHFPDSDTFQANTYARGTIAYLQLCLDSTHVSESRRGVYSHPLD